MQKEEVKEVEDVDEYEAQTVGEILRNTRMKQKKKLQEAAEVLCIRTSYLEAIENMDIKNIPPAPYGTGFVRSYAEYLGLNGERILSSYKKSVYGVSEQSKKPQEKSVETSGPEWSHIFWALLGLAAVAYAWIEFPLFQSDNTVTDFENSLENAPIAEPLITDSEEENVNVLPEETTINIETTVVEENVAAEPLTAETAETPVAEQMAEETAKASAAEAPKPAEVKMVFSGPSWVELRQNGKVILSRTMQRGREYIIEDAENSTVTIGRQQNVKFYINGKEAKVVNALRRKNVALKEFIEKQNQD